MSLNIIVDADVSSASSKISKFSYEVKQSFESIQTVINKTAGGFSYGTKSMSDSMGKFSKDSRTALTNLSLVLQDLPYGFIGIQNNLPFLANSFTDLAKKSNGVLGALKNMGAALVGPAGLFLAFSAATSAVTFAVQEYGSLGNALDALTGKTGVLTKEQREIAASVAQESTQIFTLFGLYDTLYEKRDEQYSIINKLKNISPEYFGNLDTEKTKYEDLKVAIDKYIDSFISKIFIENQQKLVNDLLTKYAEKITTIINRQNEVERATKRAQEADAARIAELIKDIDIIAESKKKATGDIAIGVKPVAIKFTFQEAIDNLKVELQKELQGIFQVGDKIKPLINIDALFGEAKVAKKVPDDLDWVTRITPELREYVDNEVKKIEQSVKKFRKKRAEINKAFEDFRLDVLDKKAKPPKILERYTLELQGIIAENEQFKKKFLETKNFLMQSVFKPLEDVFEIFFEKGTAGFKEMGKVILAQIRKLAAQIIASGIVNLIAALINPIGAVAANGVKGVDLFSIFGNAAKSVLSGAVNTPRFGGVNPGGMNMGGQVAVVLRGQDLIGAINRTNLQIERLG